MDANKPVIRLEAEADVRVRLTVGLELWRTEEQPRPAHESHCPAGLRSVEEHETVYPDTVLDAGPQALAWCHHNRHSCWRATLEHQDLGAWIEAGHGEVACTALQRMLMQWDNGKIHLLPAWPESWTVDFRLHGPGGTMVEGHAEGGVISELKVIPETRRSDVQVCEAETEV